MSSVIIEEMQAAVTAFFSGVMITLVYDGLRIFRSGVFHGNFWIGVEDFFFWLWTAFWIFSVLYRENDGELRFYTIFFMGLGMILYHQTVSEPFVRIAGKLLRRLWLMVSCPFKLLKIYIQFIGKKLKKLMLSFIMRVIGRKDA